MRRDILANAGLMATLAILAALALLPMYMTVNISQKEAGELVHNLWSPPRGFHPEFYLEAGRHLLFYMRNSIIVASFVVLGVVVLSSVSGYVFARISFRGREVYFNAIICLMMVPGILTLIPSYLWMKEFPLAGGNNLWGEGGSGLLNSWWVMILPGVAWGQFFGIYMFRTFFRAVPEELVEAARLEGAGELRVLFSVMLPLSRPVFAAVAMLQFIGVYNDYVWPLITISDPARQMFGVGITRFVAEGNLQPGPMMAGYVIGAIPLVILFAFGMRHYVAGVSQGAIK